MHVRTTLAHLCGQKIQVGDKHIQIDAQGIVSDLDDETAQHLLSSAGRVWLPHDPKDTGVPMPKKERRGFVRPIGLKITEGVAPKDEDDDAATELQNDPLLNPTAQKVGAGAPPTDNAGAPPVDDAGDEETEDPSTGVKTRRPRIKRQ